MDITVTTDAEVADPTDLFIAAREVFVYPNRVEITDSDGGDHIYPMADIVEIAIEDR